MRLTKRQTELNQQSDQCPGKRGANGDKHAEENDQLEKWVDFRSKIQDRLREKGEGFGGLEEKPGKEEKLLHKRWRKGAR